LTSFGKGNKKGIVYPSNAINFSFVIVYASYTKELSYAQNFGHKELLVSLELFVADLFISFITGIPLLSKEAFYWLDVETSEA